MMCDLFYWYLILEFCKFNYCIISIKTSNFYLKQINKINIGIMGHPEMSSARGGWVQERRGQAEVGGGFSES